jgi:hypothetical protein
MRWFRMRGPVVATLALYAGLMALYVFKNGGHPCALLCAGSNRAGRPPYEAVTLSLGPNGYDGQFYYAIARNPWRTHEGELIDDPPGRHARILYPALCWLFSGGDRQLLFWVMPAVNLLALAGLAGVGTWFAVRHGRSPWWGFALPLALNAGMPALHNLTDPLSTLAVFGLLAAWLAGADARVLTACAAAALLGREQNLAVVLILLAASVYKRRYPVTAGLLASLVLWLSWVGVLRSWYGSWPFIGPQGNFDLPFAGMEYRWTHPGGNDHFSRRLSVILVASMIHLTFEIGLAFYLVPWWRDRAVTLCMLAGVGLAFVAGTSIYCDFWSYTRVFVWLPMGIWLLGLRGRMSWPQVSLSPAFLWTLVAALRYV